MVLPINLTTQGTSIPTLALIDSGATATLIDATFAQSNSIRLSLKTTPQNLVLADGRPISSGTVIHETLPVQLTIGSHTENIQFDVTSLSHYPIILGMPWLERHNPTIDWSEHQVVFDSEHCSTHCLKQPPAVQSLTEHQTADAPTTEPPSSRPVPQPTGAPDVSIVSATAFQRSIKQGGELFFLSPAKAPEPVNSPSQATVPPGQESVSRIPPEYNEFADVFSKESASVLPPHRPHDHRIPLEPGTTPPFGPLYSLSEVELKALDEYIKENLSKGYIQASTSPAGAPILFVKKRDGSLRLCVDYRGLNKITVKNRYPLPLISESLDRLRSATVFTKLDLRSGYNLVRIAEGDEWKTAFRTRYGHYEYRVMPFGLTNAPATFQNLMNDIFREFLDDFAIVYLDDILIFSQTLEEHKRHVRLVLERLRANGLFAKPEKCSFYQDEIDYLGYIVSANGIKMDPKKVSAITEWPEPTSVNNIQSFLGFANFYRRFIKDYSRIAAPLTRLLKKNPGSSWTTQPARLFSS